MKTSVKLIGGIGDGETVELEHGQTRYQFRKTAMSATPVTASPLDGRDPATLESKTQIYTVRILQSPNGRIVYMAPEEMTDIDAIKHQFSK